MDRLDQDDSVPEWLIEYPQLSPLFEVLGIDYSCGGKSLLFACQEKHLNHRVVLALIEQLVSADRAVSEGHQPD